MLTPEPPLYNPLMANQFTSQQLKAIKDAPKGQLPRFISAGIGRAPGVVSAGGRVGPIGASIGISKGKPFGSANIKGKIIGKFGPQE